jgi:hypothetical protein
VSVDYSVQRLWWGHHPIRLHRPLRHRCRTALACGLTHDVAALFGDHLVRLGSYHLWCRHQHYGAAHQRAHTPAPCRVVGAHNRFISLPPSR